ncbi:MAG: glycosyltransferase family 4 protein [Pseudomonadota bacterium]
MSGVSFAFALFKYFPHGGLQRDFLKFTRTALERGHRVRAYAPDWDQAPADLAGAAQLDLVRIERRGWTNHARDAAFARAVLRHHAAAPTDLLFGFNKMPGLDAYYVADSCYVAKAHAQRSRGYRLLPRYRGYAALEQAVFAAAAPTRILAISARELAIYQQVYGTPSSRCLLLPPGIEPDRVALNRSPEQEAKLINAVRADLGLTPGERLLCFIGSGFRKKGLDRALRAFAALPAAQRDSLRLLVAGRDKAAPFQALARQLDIADRVIWATAGRDDIPACLAASSGCLLPALDENTGTVILEAMLSGVPVLATANCGYAHYLSDYDAGLVCPEPFQQHTLNAQLEALLDPAAQARWSANGRAAGSDPRWFQLSDSVLDELERLADVRRLASATPSAAIAAVDSRAPDAH